MSYRDDAEALRTHRARTASLLAEARAAADGMRAQARRVDALEEELRETDALLARSARRSLPLLERVEVASPCGVEWDTMTGDDRVRFCPTCAKNVYNLSALPADQAEAFLRNREGAACIRLYRRADGTVLTADCPVGTRRKRNRRAKAAIAGGILAAAAGLAACAAADRRVVMGVAPMPQPSTDVDAGPTQPPGWTTGAMPVPVPQGTATPSPAR